MRLQNALRNLHLQCGCMHRATQIARVGDAMRIAFYRLDKLEAALNRGGRPSYEDLVC